MGRAKLSEQILTTLNTKHFIELSSLEETQHFGRRIGRFCEEGDIVCLGGEMGAGKTTLTQAMASEIGVAEGEYICSPTFAILHEYQGKIPIYHMDFYRLSSSDDVAAMGLEEYFYQEGICVIEWYERALDIVPDHSLLVDLTVLSDQKRSISLTSASSIWQKKIMIIISEFSS